MKYFLVLCLVFLSSQWALAGEIIVDGSTAAATKSSLKKMQKGLTRKEKQIFPFALMSIQLSDVKSASEAMEKNLYQNLNYEVLVPNVDGLNKTKVEAPIFPDV
jgi:hypothetical protein